MSATPTLREQMEAQKRIPGKTCVVCGEACRNPMNNPGWIMSLVEGARAHGFTLKAPASARVHDSCRDNLQALIDRKKTLTRSHNENADVRNTPPR